MAMRDQLLFGAAGAALIAVALGAWLLLAPAPSAAPGVDLAAGLGPLSPTAVPLRSGPATSKAAPLLVDVEGGVARPGIVRLPAEARVGDAISAAGGYAPSADLLVAAASLNLAAPVTDGQQVYVPIVGVTPAPGSVGAGPSSGGGLVNLNDASPEQLDTLPGIGPVTVQKIVAARQERPFATLDELVERKVLNAGQLDKLRDLVIV